MCRVFIVVFGLEYQVGNTDGRVRVIESRDADRCRSLVRSRFVIATHDVVRGICCGFAFRAVQPLSLECTCRIVI